MDDTPNVVEESLPLEAESPADTEGLLVDALNEMRADDEESTPSDAPDEQGETEAVADESTDVKAEAKVPDAKAKAEEPEINISKKAFLKRVNGLQAAKRKLEGQGLEQERQLSEYREAFQIMRDRLVQSEQRLAEYQEVDPRQAQLEQYEREKYATEVRQKLEHEHQQRVARQQQEAYVESRAEEIVEEANKLAEKYPTVSAEELVYKFRASDKEMKVLARQMHDKRYGFYKEKMAKDYKKPKSPRAVKAQGAMASIGGISEDDMMEYLQANRS